MFGARLERWDKMLEWPLIVATCLFLVAYATEIVWRPGIGTATVLWGTWALFLVDYIVRLSLAENRWRWFRAHLLDLAVVALPMLRPLRLMRFLTIVALIQRNAGSRLRGQVVAYTIGATILILLLAALAVLDAEKGGSGNIQSFGEALWWSFVTMTTVGYGDYAPVTGTGRAVAAGLMVGGVGLIGVVTATLASWIVERVSLESTSASSASEERIEDLRREVRELKNLVQGLAQER
ncbi:ion transporter [Tessaracoccus aquimaris]|uniref:Ion transporter n=1 Tax=Tessaracoccus aquimaris TaxID=1332264 RepID=A0A1Q2CPD7_9ACTN|nr:potassium channel family protein [Tessaracoccus aquimaris]AQP47964.1 ion transporter [Tessaracoccus aquimaris]